MADNQTIVIGYYAKKGGVPHIIDEKGFGLCDSRKPSLESRRERVSALPERVCSICKAKAEKPPKPVGKPEPEAKPEPQAEETKRQPVSARARTQKRPSREEVVESATKSE